MSGIEINYVKDINMLFAMIFVAYGIEAFTEKYIPINYNAKNTNREILYGFVFIGFALCFWYVFKLYDLLGFAWWVIAAYCWIFAWWYRRYYNDIHYVDDT